MISPIAAHLPVPHGFFTRQGGVSEGPYASLNASLSGGDDVRRVRENRARAAAAVGADRLVGLRQVHGATVLRVGSDWPESQRADAMVTNHPGTGLGIITADCAPVLLADQAAGVVGAAHAGWRGAVAGVLEAAVGAMAELGATRIEACIGPCIAADSYEVGPDVYAAAEGLCCTPGRAEHWQFDLAGYCALRLARAGVAARILGIDTLSDSTRFFSHRRRTLAGGGPIGHQISIVVCP